MTKTSVAPLTSSDQPAVHMPQLDSLRAVAVVAVIVHHYLPGGWGPGADIGVKLFFTLSGFLITGLLMRSRRACIDGRQTLRGAIGRFYARRFLRIFPLYYLVIAIALVVGLPPTRDILGWLLSYTLNIHMARQGWFEDNFAHFWSLAVEEQFYLVWPWAVFLLPIRMVPAAAVTMTLCAPLYRLGYVLSDYENMTGLSSYISTWSCLDSLGCGALLALARESMTPRRFENGLLRVVLPVGATAAILFTWVAAAETASLVLYPVAQALIFCVVIAFCAKGIGGLAGVFLNLRPVQYLGKISYGLYVYHPLLLTGVLAAAERAGLAPKGHPWAIGVSAAILSLGISALSWAAFEGPINELKRHFRDPVGPPQEAVTVRASQSTEHVGPLRAVDP